MKEIDRKSFTQSLRDIADFYETHPDLPLPQKEQFSNYSFDTPEEAKKIVKALGDCEKVYEDDFFEIHKKIGCFTIRFVFSRENFCELVQTGEKVTREPIYEWRCSESILAPDSEVA